MKLKDRIKTYNFWVSLASALFLIINLIGQKFNFHVDEIYFNDFFTALCGILVLLGIIAPPTNAKKQPNLEGSKTPESGEPSTNSETDKSSEIVVNSETNKPNEVATNFEAHQNLDTNNNIKDYAESTETTIIEEISTQTPKEETVSKTNTENAFAGERQEFNMTPEANVEVTKEDMENINSNLAEQIYNEPNEVNQDCITQNTNIDNNEIIFSEKANDDNDNIIIEKDAINVQSADQIK